MKLKITTAIIMFMALFLLSPQANFVSAASNDDYGAQGAAKAAGLSNSIAGASNIPALIGKIIAVVLSMIGILFFLLILYAGFTWMMAMGNSETVTKAKGIIEAAVIGLVLISAAYAISSFVFSKLGASGGGGDTGDNSNASSAAVTSSDSLDDKCKDKPEKTDCSDSNPETKMWNMQCNAQGKCVPKCTIEFGGQEGSCIASSDCSAKADFTSTPYKCPGADDIVCCHKK